MWRFVWAVAALVAGEAAGFRYASYATLWPWAAVATGLLLLFAIGWDLRFAVLPLLFAGGAILAWRTECRLSDVTVFFSRRHDGRPPSVELDVSGEVDVRRRREGGGRVVSFPSSIGPVPVKVVAVLSTGAEVPRPGERWRCGGWLSLKKGAPSRYSRHTLWVADGMRFERVRRAGAFSPTAIAARSRRAFSEKASAGLGRAEEIAAMNRAILLGRSADFPRERRREFAAAGTIHVFAISGLHVMLAVALLKRLLGNVVPSRRVVNAVCIAAVPCYAVLTGLSPSAVRASAMAVLYLAAPLFGRRPDSLVAWAVTAIAVFALHPERLFDMGCALSFTVIFGLLFWARWTRSNGISFERVFGLNDRLRIADGFFISLAAWVAGAPLVAHMFGRMVFGGLVVNLVVVAAAGVTVAFGAMGIAAGFFSPPLSMLFNGLAGCVMSGMASVSHAVAVVPWLSCSVRPWNALECAAWYGAWILVLMAAEHVLCSLRRRWPTGLPRT